MNKLLEIQLELKSPKSEYNQFGKYKYRTCEGIIEAVKPLLKEQDMTLNLTDTIKEAGSFVYVEAKATLIDDAGKEVGSTTAQAGITELKGMTLAQSFGASSSYARKYALSGLFLIDSEKDQDATHDHGKGRNESTPKPRSRTETTLTKDKCAEMITECTDMKQLRDVWGLITLSPHAKDPKIISLKDNQKIEIETGAE